MLQAPQAGAPACCSWGNLHRTSVPPHSGRWPAEFTMLLSVTRLFQPALPSNAAPPAGRRGSASRITRGRALEDSSARASCIIEPAWRPAPTCLPEGRYNEDGIGGRARSVTSGTVLRRPGALRRERVSQLVAWSRREINVDGTRGLLMRSESILITITCGSRASWWAHPYITSGHRLDGELTSVSIPRTFRGRGRSTIITVTHMITSRSLAVTMLVRSACTRGLAA